jgi:hypothetical protein
MVRKEIIAPIVNLEDLIHEVREQKIILDTDLARIYGVPTYRFNEAFKRNRHRFPSDFAFQLTAKEFANLRSQAATAAPQTVGKQRDAANSSQFAMSSTLRRGATYRPWAFTEHGALQAANILRSPRAVQMSVFVVRAFLKMRALLGDKRELAKQLAALEKELKQRLDIHEAAIVTILQRVMDIIDPPSGPPMPDKRKIGFKP